MATTEHPEEAPGAEEAKAAEAAAGAPPPDAPPPDAPPEDPELEIRRTRSRAVIETLMPLVEAYAGRVNIEAAQLQTRGRIGIFTAGEEAALAAAGRKAFAETVQYTSRHYAAAGAQPFEAIAEDGKVKTPDALQLLSLVKAANAFVAGSGEREPAQAPEPPQVVLLAVKPGEYPYADAPLTPAEARRAAYMQRIETPPPQAMLMSQPGGASAIVPVQSSGQAAMMRASSHAHGSGYGSAMSLPGAGYGAAGGGCGCAACAGGRAGFAFPDARYKEDGSCKSILSISCETQWRLHECFKIALCDALRCIGGELCEDGRFKPNPDFKPCLEQFVCTLVACLPEAICPTDSPQACCLPGDAVSCGCNFAVGK